MPKTLQGQTMKNVLFVLIFVLFAGCMSDRERYEKEFTDGCLRKNYPLQGKEAQKACECFAKLMTSKLTDDDIRVAMTERSTAREEYELLRKMRRLEREVLGDKQAFEKYIRECMQK